MAEQQTLTNITTPTEDEIKKVFAETVAMMKQKLDESTEFIVYSVDKKGTTTFSTICAPATAALAAVALTLRAGVLSGMMEPSKKVTDLGQRG